MHGLKNRFCLKRRAFADLIESAGNLGLFLAAEFLQSGLSRPGVEPLGLSTACLSNFVRMIPMNCSENNGCSTGFEHDMEP